MARELQYTYEREYSFILPVLRIFGVMSESKANSNPLWESRLTTLNNSESPEENSIICTRGKGTDVEADTVFSPHLSPSASIYC